MEDVYLYHGSRGGLQGSIQPISRARCDFGKGFYLGESGNQVKGLIYNDSSPIIYTMKLKLSEIPDEKILYLTGKDWLFTVLANRQKSKSFTTLDISNYYLELCNNADVIIGPIADDRMNEAIKAFENGALSDAGLMYCLTKVNYGNQFALKTDFACSKVEILNEREIYDDELKEIEIFAKSKREEGAKIVQEAIKLYRRQGLYIDEIIQNESQLDRGIKYDITQ